MRISTYSLALLALGSVLWAQGNKVPAEAVLRDAVGDRIVSDGSGAYLDDVDYCTTSYVSNQFSFVRSTRFECTTPISQRKIKIDFSNAMSRTPDGSDPCLVDDAFGHSGGLDICGLNEIIDVRIIAERLFGPNASSTPVTLPISTQRSYNKTGYHLKFVQNVPVSAPSANVRVLTAGSAAVAELVKNLNKGTISLGTFYAPFELTVTKLLP